MIALLQRVSSAQVTVKDHLVGKIDQGILVFLGIEKTDTPELCDKLAQRVIDYRIFTDKNQLMNLSVKDTCGSVLVVSQFTLAADTKKGLRPSFTPAALPEMAEPLYQRFMQHIKANGIHVQNGEFGAKMAVSLTNDGPVTFLLEV